MRVEPYLCLGGVEISNGARVAAYVNNVGLPGTIMDNDCQCFALGGNYSLPNGEAPWWEPTRPESADFLGFYAAQTALQPVASREVTQNGRRSSILAPLTLKGRVMEVSGLLLAVSAEGMAYGERWLQEVLRGGVCGSDGCAMDDLVFLPACPEYSSYDPDPYYRKLVGVGLVDGPLFGQVEELPECRIQRASFALASSQPYLYHPANRCHDGTVLANNTLPCSLTTPSWMGEGTFAITITNTDTTDTTNIIIKGQISLDGSCPVTGTASTVPPTFTYTIPTLEPENVLVIDGTSRQAHYWDASCKQWASALPLMTLTGPFRWPDVGPCTTMCLTVSATGGTSALTVDTYLKEL